MQYEKNYRKICILHISIHKLCKNVIAKIHTLLHINSLFLSTVKKKIFIKKAINNK